MDTLCLFIRLLFDPSNLYGSMESSITLSVSLYVTVEEWLAAASVVRPLCTMCLCLLAVGLRAPRYSFTLSASPWSPLYISAGSLLSL